MSAKSKGFRSEQYNCPYRFKCGCYVALSVKYFTDKVVLMQAGDHDLNSHTKKRGLLSVKQRGAVKRAARSAPLQVGRQIQDSMLDCSPGNIFRTTGGHKMLSVDWCAKLARKSWASAYLALAWTAAREA